MFASISLNALRVAAHLEAHVETLVHAEFLLHIGEFFFGHIHRARHTHALGQVEPVFVDVGDHHVPRAGVPGDGGGHDPDWPRAGHQHVLAQHGETQRRVCGIAKRVEDGGDIKVDARLVHPHVGLGQGDVLRERAGPRDADAGGVVAQMPPAGHAVAAMPANHVPLAAHQLADAEVTDVFADLNDFADELMPHHERHRHGFAGPVVPFVNVQIGAADAGAVHLDEDVIGRHPGLRHVLEPKSLSRLFFNECLHLSEKRFPFNGR